MGAHVVRFGQASDTASVTRAHAPYLLLTVALCVGWWSLLGASGSREPRILGAGAEEYKRVVSTSLWLFGLLAIVSYAFQLDLARGYIGVALPAGMVGLLAGRWILRQHLGMERVQGASTFKLLLVGGPTAVTHLVESLRRFPGAGYKPVAAYLAGLPASAMLDPELKIPVIGYEPAVPTIMAAVRQSDADAVAMTAGVHLHPEDMRHLGWELAAANIGLIVAPALTDIAGPRIHTQPVAGLPLIHVTTPTLDGGKRVAKRVFDLLASGLLILVSAPVMLMIALLVRLDSKGPVLFRQERVGVDGEPFIMYKFRSMKVGAENMLAELAARNEGSGVLFKMKRDPRVTRIGAQLRRFSLDELPQLFNVLQGAMSLVGPRPPLPAEVDAYEKHVRRRLLVKPGLTGLWQVSGRSNLSWQDSVRLDLYYVENWSMAGDILILLRTARAVVKRDGAY
ncbi:sugar transferase [Paenarthrobacter sp. DKR-5]|uniref:sugar transferase n=1 Tax=Paenarthrobacter sp. DKR-5 TaxID=2835535 RepID=UPI0035AE75D4